MFFSQLLKVSQIRNKRDKGKVKANTGLSIFICLTKFRGILTEDVAHTCLKDKLGLRQVFVQFKLSIRLLKNGSFVLFLSC